MVVSLYIDELKYRLLYVIYGSIVCFIVTYSYATECFYLLAVPYCELRGEGFFLLISIFEILFGYIKIAFIISAVYFLVLGILNIWLFIIPTLYKSDSGKVRSVLKSIFLMSIAAIYIIYNYILSLVYFYVLKLSDINGIGGYMLDVEPRMLSFIDLTVKLIFLFYIILILPLIFYQTSKYIGKSIELLNYRLWFYFFIVVIIVAILPPDMFLHSGVFLMIYTLIECSILMLLVFKSYKNYLVNKQIG